MTDDLPPYDLAAFTEDLATAIFLFVLVWWLI